jgi:hypothetical protein
VADAAVNRIGVAGRQENISLRSDEERAEGMIPARPTLPGDLDRKSHVLGIGRHGRLTPKDTKIHDTS